LNVWRDRLQRWFTPLARRSPLSPNAVTLLALAIQLIAAACFYFGARDPRLFLVAMVLVVIGGLADAFDGIVARVQQKESRYGDFLDHFADRVADLSLAAGWLLGNGVRQELTIATLMMVMLSGYVGTQIEATWKEREYATLGRGEFVLALIVFPIISYIVGANGWRDARLLTFTTSECLALLMAAFALLGIIQRLAVAARMDRA